MKLLTKLLALMIMTCSLAFAKEQVMKVDTTPQSRVFKPSTHACAEVQIVAAIPHINITQSLQAAAVVRTTGATICENTVHCEAIVHRARSKVAAVDSCFELAPQPTGPLGPDCPAGAFVAETIAGPLGPDNPGDGRVATDTTVRQEGMTKAKVLA